MTIVFYQSIECLVSLELVFHWEFFFSYVESIGGPCFFDSKGVLTTNYIFKKILNWYWFKRSIEIAESNDDNRKGVGDSNNHDGLMGIGALWVSILDKLRKWSSIANFKNWVRLRILFRGCQRWTQFNFFFDTYFKHINFR